MSRSPSDTCRRGHPWTPGNTRVEADGARRCRICNRAWWRRYRKPAPASAEPDPIAVDRAVAGDLNGTKLMPAEREEAVRRLTAAGVGGRRIAEQIGCTPRSVVRIRARLREDAP